MSQETKGQAELPVLQAQDLVYRAMLREDWIDQETQEVLPAAYMRGERDVHGISVGIVATYPLKRFIRKWSRCYGVATLKVQDTRNITDEDGQILGIDIVPDSIRHANINTHIPYQTDNLIKALHIATQLADDSTMVDGT